MAGIDTKETEAQSYITWVKTTYGSTGAGCAGIDELCDLAGGDTSGLKDLAKNLVTDQMNDILKGYGLQCGGKQIFGEGNIFDTFDKKMNLLKKLGDGTILNQTLQYAKHVAQEGLTCVAVASALAALQSVIETAKTITNQIEEVFEEIDSLIDEGLKTLAYVNEMLGCGQDLLQSVTDRIGVLGEFNSFFNTANTAITNAIASGYEGKALYEKAKQNITHTLDLENRIKEKVTTLTNLDNLFF